MFAPWMARGCSTTTTPIPSSLNNLIDNPNSADLRRELDNGLQRRLNAQNDAFLPGAAYIEQWGYTVNETGTVPYAN